MNKFRDPMTGDVFESIRDAYTEFCNRKSAKECYDCQICIKNNQTNLFCFEFVAKFPEKAARLMGYEVIEGSSTEIDETPSDTPTVSGDTPTEEDNIMKKISKPRLAELLGVEVGEKFQVKGVYTKDIAFFVDAEGIMRWTNDGMISDLIIYTIINHPERIVRLPRLTEPEIAIMRAIGAKWVSVDANGGSAHLWSGKPARNGDMFYHDGDIQNLAIMENDFFPSVKPGECIELEEASHGESEADYKEDFTWVEGVEMTPQLAANVRQYFGCPRGPMGLKGKMREASSIAVVLEYLSDAKPYVLRGQDERFVCIPEMWYDYCLNILAKLKAEELI